MSTVPQPDPGEELHTSWAATLIAELTSILTRLGVLEAATPVNLCDTAGQDVADAGAAGSSTYASRCDHVHEGVHSLVAGTNITLSPTSGLGDVTVASSGGGVALEGDYTTWTLSQTVVVTSGTRFIEDGSCFTNDEASILVNADGSLYLVTVSTGAISLLTTDMSVQSSIESDTSVLGKYMVTVSQNNKNVFIYRNGALAQTLTVANAGTDNYYYVIISPSGKYILISHFYYAGGVESYTWQIYEGA